MNALGPGLDYADLEFLGASGVIAAAFLHGPDGVAVVDPGPATTIGALERALRARGFTWGDVRALLLTHIHLDHAGAAGTLVQRCPHARVYVHERGAAHVADPSALVASAARLYGDDMARLWGEVLPVPADRLHVLETGPAEAPGPLRLQVAGHDVEVAYTPGHASHHVSYFVRSARVAFVGDTAGLCRPTSRVVVPATPPPDVHLERWRASTARILAWDPDVLFLTHFGPQPSPRAHLDELWRRLEDWSQRVRASLATDAGDESRAAAFGAEVTATLVRDAGAAEAAAYASAGRFDFSWLGLARYWRKHDDRRS